MFDDLATRFFLNQVAYAIDTQKAIRPLSNLDKKPIAFRFR